MNGLNLGSNLWKMVLPGISVKLTYITHLLVVLLSKLGAGRYNISYLLPSQQAPFSASV